jgi:dethiobiotin synthase
MRVIGVTGTDTGVGKTRITAGLARALRDARVSVAALKPVASGVIPGEDAEDAVLLGAAADHEPRVFASFEAAISPHRAAALEGRSVDRGELNAWIRQFPAAVVLVEGAGGLRSPIGDDAGGRYFVDDLAVDALIVVAPNRLGVLNHLGMTLECSKRPILGVVLNDGARVDGDPSFAYNHEDLAAMLSGVPLARAPFGDVDAIAASLAGFARSL